MMRMKGVRNMKETSKTFSKNVMAIALALMMAAGSIIAVGASAATKVAKDPTAATRVSKKDEYYIFKLSPKVNRQHVYYRNRFGIELAGDLYTAKNLDKNQKHPALVIGPPFGGVKEQGPGVYANQLAQRGFVVLTFDPSYHGYSGGQPRYNGSAAVYAEDFSAGVDFLGMQKFVDRDKIGAIGICGSGGFALDAASMDTRIKAVATSVMYDIAGNMNAISGNDRKQLLKQSSEQRWKDLDAGKQPKRNDSIYPDKPADKIPDGLDPVTAEFFSFYGMKRGWHPNALTNITVESAPDFMTFHSTDRIDEISPRPVLLIAGENAHSLQYSKDAYAKLKDPKELYIVKGANHVDLYDDVSKIPFDKLVSFFNNAFRQ